MLRYSEIEVTCDGELCLCHDYIGLTATARGYDEWKVEAELEYMGWLTIGDNRHLCQDCAQERDK